jgi:hypothetical protein
MTTEFLVWEENFLVGYTPHNAAVMAMPLLLCFGI